MDRALIAVVTLLLPFPACSQLVHQGPAAGIARAQSLQPYTVVSVKQNASDKDRTPGNHASNFNFDDHGTFIAVNMPLVEIVELAYDVKQDQVVGLSGPVSDARFDITAKIQPPDSGPGLHLSDADEQAMIILLLRDRFHLKAHLESRTSPVYDLVVAKGGSKFKLDSGNHIGSWDIKHENEKRTLRINRGGMSDLAAMLGDEVHRNVIDQTGLSGFADLTLTWSDVDPQVFRPDVVTIFTAVEMELGLKLQPAKAPVDTLVIDHAEMP